VGNSKTTLVKIARFVSGNATLISIVLLMTMITSINRNFLGAFNVKNLLSDASTLLVIAVGVTFPIFLGSTDLSVGSIASLFCVITGTYIGAFGNIIILYSILAGALLGLVTGLLLVTYKIPSFVVTFCTGNIFAVAAKVLSGGAATSIPLDKWSLISWAGYAPLGIPVPFFISIVITCALFFVQKWTALGKSIFATGANEQAARMMGINVRMSKTMAYVISGTCASMCGVLLSLKLKSNSPTAGSSMTLIAIAAVALGGTTLFGGNGSVLKTLSGVLLVTIIRNALNLFGVDAFWSDIVFGTLLILAVVLQGEKGMRAVLVK